jgi:hypothetical protein
LREQTAFFVVSTIIEQLKWQNLCTLMVNHHSQNNT